MFSRATFVTALFVTLLTPSVARAEGLIIPFFGVNFGGDSGKDLGDAADANRFNYGVSVAFMGGGVIGVEADISYSPDFYGKSDARRQQQPDVHGEHDPGSSVRWPARVRRAPLRDRGHRDDPIGQSTHSENPSRSRRTSSGGTSAEV